MKFAWLTDIHLNFLCKSAREAFYEEMKSLGADAFVITGDIAEAPSVIDILTEFADYIKLSIYFVCGNHDYYHGSVYEVRYLLNEALSHENLIYLGDGYSTPLTEDTVLVGIDGWGDARHGDFDNTHIRLNDSRLIAELWKAEQISYAALKEEMQRLADEDASDLDQVLNATLDNPKTKRIMIATHVPPFPEASYYNRKQSDKNWMPFFTCKATGDVIHKYATQYPKIDFLVLCGHTHEKREVKILSNLEVRTGGAKYEWPQLQEIIKV